MEFIDGYNDLIEEDLEKLSKFNFVKDYDVLIKEILSLKDNEQFIQMGLIPKTGFNKKDNDWVGDETKVSFLNAAKTELYSLLDKYIFLPPFTKTIDYMCLLTLYTMIQLNYIYNSKEKLSADDYKSIVLGDIGAYLTYFVEDFENSDIIPEPSLKFFKDLNNLKFGTRDVQKFSDRIYSLLGNFTMGYHLGGDYTRTIYYATIYLMGCSALKRNRDVITYDDVVTAYLTICKLFKIDIRPLVKKGYEKYDGYYSDKI